MDTNVWPLISGMAGVLMGYGALRATVTFNSKRLNGVEKKIEGLDGTSEKPSPFMTRSQCDTRVLAMNRKLDSQQKCIWSLVKYARWVLISDKGMTLQEADKVLGIED